MGAALQLGPFVLPGAVLVLAAAAAVTGVTGKHMGGANGRDVETLIWQTLLFGLLVARLAFVWQFRSAYWATPLEVLDIRDGGWSSEAGFAGAWLFAIARTSRKPTLKRPLLWAMAVGSAVWLAGSIAVAVLPGKGQPLPEIELATAQGTRANLSDYVGKPTVVNIWATWCPPCVREMPVLQQAQIDYPSINFIFLNQRESAERVNAWMAARQLTLRNVLLDDKAQAAAAFKQTALPTTLFFNANGELVSTRIGELSKASLTERLESLAP